MWVHFEYNKSATKNRPQQNQQILQRKSLKPQQNKPILFLHETSLSRRKTLGMPENTGFLGSVVAKKCYQFVIRIVWICR